VRPDASEERRKVDQQTPQVLGALQKAEIKKWWPIIKAANNQSGIGHPFLGMSASGGDLNRWLEHIG